MINHDEWLHLTALHYSPLQVAMLLMFTYYGERCITLLCFEKLIIISLDRLHGRVVKGMGHLGHDEAMEAGGREFSLHDRVVKGVGHLDHDEAMKAGGREFSLHG